MSWFLTLRFSTSLVESENRLAMVPIQIIATSYSVKCEGWKPKSVNCLGSRVAWSARALSTYVLYPRAYPRHTARSSSESWSICC